MQVDEEHDDHVGQRPSRRRAYMTMEVAGPSLKDEKQTQTELLLVATGKTRFVTPQIVLSTEEAAHSPYAEAFAELCRRIRSPSWASSMLVVLGHDPEKHRDDLERNIREDEAAEAIHTELRVFFDTVLAPAMQERETAIVNTIHECVQQEMHAKELVTQKQQQRLAQLTQQTEEWEKQVVHLKAKVDRRVAENNALRKEQYRQLLMLRDIVSKQGTEPGALSALNEAIATVLAGKQHVSTPEITQSNNEPDQAKAPGRGWMSGNANVQALHREKEKWEQKAKEANAECEGLRDKIARLTQENSTYRATESAPWFLKPQNAIVERQRIADAVCSYQSNWEEIGDSLVELLNNDILWAAVEQSARRGGKRRVSRGLEVALAQLDNSLQPLSIEEEPATYKRGQESITPQLGRRRSTLTDLGRLIPCKACNGIGYVHADKGYAGTNDTDSYLRKTLEQLLELKTQLDKANTKALTLEGQLQLSHMQSAQLQEKIQQAELIKSTAVDSCLQTDLDEEEGIDLDEIMHSAYGQDAVTTASRSRQKRRNTQYDHLIVELKSTLAVKDEGLAESRRALDVAQARTAKLQRALQKEKETHAEELAMLKSSLAFSLKTRNSKIEERQAAVKLLMKKFSKKTSQPPAIKQPSATSLPPMDEAELDEESDNNDEDHKQDVDSGALLETKAMEPCNEPNELKQMEALAQRYAEDIVRVRKEYDTQQELLKKAEAEIAEEDEKRGRTNSISQGSLIVSMASHPRDLFKALSTAQADILKLRRASQRSSALQTDRLLTLTTHLGHMSEELCTLRKRNLAELEFWKLECEKLQNTNKALEAERQIYRKQQLQERHSQGDFGDSLSARTCSMCEGHKKRLLQISNDLLKHVQVSRSDPEVEVPAPSTLTDAERELVSSVLLDLETIYAGMTSAKQQLARDLVASHLGSALRPRSARRTAIDATKSEPKAMNQSGKDGGLSVPTRSTGNSSKKSSAGLKVLKSSRQLKKTGGEVLDGKINCARSPSSVSHVKVDKLSESYGRKALVQEILEDGGLSLTKLGLRIEKRMPELSEIDVIAKKKPNADLDNNSEDANTGHTAVTNSHDTFSDWKGYEAQFAPASEYDEHALTLQKAGHPVVNTSNYIRRDPEIISQLRDLINQSTAAKERVAITRWQVLVSRIIFLMCEQRFEQIKFAADRRARIHPDGTLRPASRNITSIRVVMAKMAQYHQVALETAMAAQDLSRRDLRKAEAQLIHGVAALLDTLSRKGKPVIELREILFPNQGGSPRRSPTNNRPLFPSTKVHLNQLPQTQQIPTSTFPALVAPKTGEIMRPSSSGCSGEPSTGHSEGYHLPNRLIRSAGPRPFHLVHSSIGALQGSIPFPDPVYIRSLHASSTTFAPQRPARPHSSPAGPRLTSCSLYRPGQITESETD